MSILAKMRHLALLFIMCLCVSPTLSFALDALPDIPPSEKGDSKKDAKTDEDKSTNTEETDAKGKKHKKPKMSKVDDVDADLDKKHEKKSESSDGLLGDARIKLLLYDEADVYTITTRYGYQTNIVFGPQEEIELISVGDRSLWQIIPSGNRMFIRPMEDDVITNMTVLTNKHSYQFDLKSISAEKTGNIYVAKFVYEKPRPVLPVADTFVPPHLADAPAGMGAPLPASSPFGVGPSVPQSASVAVGAPVQVAPAPTYAAVPSQAPQPAGGGLADAIQAGAIRGYPNYSYTYAGPDDVAPLQVYDDGRATYLKYRDIGRLTPTVFIIDRAGKETPVNYSIKGDLVVVDAVVGELALKSGGNTIHVFNEMLNPG